MDKFTILKNEKLDNKGIKGQRVFIKQKDEKPMSLADVKSFAEQLGEKYYKAKNKKAKILIRRFHD
jgi:hypothetical protein